jgi:hypothetical protein
VANEQAGKARVLDISLKPRVMHLLRRKNICLSLLGEYFTERELPLLQPVWENHNDRVILAVIERHGYRVRFLSRGDGNVTFTS